MKSLLSVIAVACVALTYIDGVSADQNQQYMDTVLRQAGVYVNQLGLDPARVPVTLDVTSGSLRAEVFNVQINGLAGLSTKKCKLEKPELECDIPLKNLKMVAYGRMSEGSGGLRDITIDMPVKEGELEIEVNSAKRETKIKFDDKLKFEKLRFNPVVSSNSKALGVVSKQLEEKLATSVAEYLSKEYFNIVKNAVTHVPMPNFRR